MADALIDAGYALVMNQEEQRREELKSAYLQQLRNISAFLEGYASAEPWFNDEFGWAEVVFTPFFQRFAFVEYYEGVGIPDEREYARLRKWHDACVSHPDAQQASREQIIKLYYDYARGAGNGALPAGKAQRRVSSFAFEPDWRDRPWPPKDKYGPGATDAELGLFLRR